ncbi:hypothetical protein [Clostridium cochlearium]|uniref:hypothetical protein n=1 Tax=Clostridium cochlearium TaxID=1494 RepID=UPI001570D9A2|nr:hypothetical protein [Clostridium cochlearium]MBV1816835.1 hypothetical protein [Bacteroidales bacterium MSK.15.36]MCG4571800.1 hypothetical protein [Clostridium cochlearium]MCG4579129.1 hypothetical protein [Clostridium cochlearium]NSJ90114.1 hypothetical protein [Coprococcus sp. MSK.21.13]
MKKGDRVYINSNFKKPQKRLNGWGERNLFGKVKLKKGTKLYHVSVFHKIKAFEPCVTCFSPEPCLDGYVYLVELKKDLIFDKIDEDEYRIDLRTLTNDDIEIHYIGIIDIDKKDVVVVDKANRIMKFPKRVSFAKKYKELEKELKAKYKKEFEITNYEKYLGYKLINIKEV